jgi:hypothetical protein
MVPTNDFVKARIGDADLFFPLHPVKGIFSPPLLVNRNLA